MLVDARRLPERETLRGDVLVVGAGPAGVTVARALADHDLQVLIADCGGPPNVSPPTASLPAAEVDSEAPRATDLVTSRRAGVGGSAGLWDMVVPGHEGFFAKHAPLEAADLERREWLPHSGWPFDVSELRPYYERAQRECQLGPFDYDPSSFEGEGQTRLPLPSESFATTMFQLGPREAFTRPEDLIEAANVSVCCYAIVTTLTQAGTSGAVRGVEAVTANGRQISFTARFVVLAMGGIENARLLLAGRSGHEGALGSRGDALGRFFMEHPAVRVGTWEPGAATFNSLGLYDRRGVPEGVVVGQLLLAPALRAREELVAVRIGLRPRPRHRGAESIGALRSVLRDRRGPGSLASELAASARTLPDIGRYLYGRARGRRTTPSHSGWAERGDSHERYRDIEVLAVSEQAPRPENRVMLRSEKDAFGRPRALLKWNWGGLELRSVERARELLAEALPATGLGHFEPVRRRGLPPLNGAHHHMGTSRMHDDPEAGVVDSHCRVHGVENLFVAGSSVFPTSGHPNPTLTVVALALRLADHIKELS
ncbi:MAG TPA: GMC family oxidoreductase [Actinomycetota bacterium]|nr:GMC family oxidoreductase [Actinomycetota bacterium]